MSRGMDREDAERDQQQTSQSRMTLSQGRGGSGSNEQERRPRDQGATSSQRSSSRARESVTHYRLSPMERETMTEIGRFRTLCVEDLTKFRYEGNPNRARQDLRNLAAQGLIEKRTVTVGRGRHTVSVVALSRDGKRLLQRSPNADSGPNGQAIYAGIVKPREIGHDAGVYRMYQAEAARIEAAGGRVQRLVLDYELKRNVFSPLAKAQDLPALEYARRQAEIADENELRVVDGKIPLPDLRIEYETSEGDHQHIDLELATEHYTRGQMAAKSRAGFKMYGVVSTSRGSRPEWEGRELTAVILGR
jgi:hypothetical protein